jgi:hypothetical protein
LPLSLFQPLSGGRLTHAPDRGSSQVANGLAAGTVDLLFDNLPTVPNMTAGGRVHSDNQDERRIASSKDAPGPDDVASARRSRCIVAQLPLPHHQPPARPRAPWRMCPPASRTG